MTCPRRVTIYLSEKALVIDRIALDMRAGEGNSPAYLRKNPSGTVPLLELDDGTFLPESGAIIEYLEELHPTPTMLGETPEQRAQARANDRLAYDFIVRQGIISAHTHPFLPKHRPGFVQYPEAGKALEGPRDHVLLALEARIGNHAFLSGNAPTIADCTLFAGLDICERLFDYQLPPQYKNLRGWYERFSTRPSAQIS